MCSKNDTVIDAVRETIRQHPMIGTGEKILAAVSGGPDSVCLLHVLVELGYPVEVGHFDHQTRNGASADDAAFVEDLANRLSLPFHFGTAPVEREADASPLSFEEYARQARYAFLLETARDRACAIVATGHHADDLAETVLMRVLRGAAPSGLAGIPPVRNEGDVRIVRPLLACTRDDVLAFLETRDIAYCTDRTNAETRHLRNRIRHELMPRLSDEYNPRVREALVRLAGLEHVENDFIAQCAGAFLEKCLLADGGLSRADFAEGHPALQRRALVLLGYRHGVECPFDRVAAAVAFVCDGPAGRSFDLGGGVTLRNAREVTEVLAQPLEQDDRVVPLDVPGEVDAFGTLFRARVLDALPADNMKSYCTPTRQVFDADALGRRIELRRRRPGDRFAPLGLSGSKKLKDYFIDLGMPVTQRDVQVLVVGERGIAWVVGHAVGAGAAVTAETRRFVEIEVDDATA